MQTLPFSEVRAQLADALRGVEAGEPVVISRRGQAAGVLMSFAQYQQLGGGTGFADQLARWRLEYAPDADMGVASEADPFEGVRQADAGRDFAW